MRVPALLSPSRTALAVVLAVLVSAGAGSSARAAGGAYTQWLCANPQTAQGTGVSGELVPSPGVGLQTAQACDGPASANSGISVALPTGTFADGANPIQLTWRAPPSVRATGLTYWRAFDLRADPADLKLSLSQTGSPLAPLGDGSPSGEAMAWNGAGGNLIGDRGTFASPFDGGNTTAGQIAADGRSWNLGVRCITVCGPSVFAYRLFAAQVSLRDESAPAILAGPTGSLATTDPLRGTVTAAFNAQDSGSGVYRTLVFVDGTLVSASVIDGYGGRCRDANPGNADAYEFGTASPCLGNVAGVASLDTTGLANGPHRVQVSVEDASGLPATLLDRVVTVENNVGVITPPSDPLVDRGAANGTPASPNAQLALSWSTKNPQDTRVANYGKAQTLPGRLTTADGRAIAGATVAVTLRTRAAGAMPRTATSVRTDATGRFQIKLPLGPGVDIAASYKAYANDPAAATTSTAVLRVRSAMRFSVAPRVARRGTSVRFTGSLRGGAVPSRGKQIILEVRAGSKGTWRQFQVVRTTSKGAFTARYRFQDRGRVSYWFRASSRYEAAYPFEAGRSAAVLVRKR